MANGIDTAMRKYKWLINELFPVLFSGTIWWARNLRRIILLHFGLVTFRFDFPKLEKVVVFMFFGPSGHDHEPQTNDF